MKLNNHDTALIRDLKNQPLFLLIGYIVIGFSGIGLAFLLELSPTMNIIVVALSGFLIGISAEKLVTKRIRHIASQLLQSDKS